MKNQEFPLLQKLALKNRMKKKMKDPEKIKRHQRTISRYTTYFCTLKESLSFFKNKQKLLSKITTPKT